MSKKSYCEACGKRTYLEGERHDDLVNRCEVKITKGEKTTFLDLCYVCADEIKEKYKKR